MISYNEIFNTLSMADCNCDPTKRDCEDWPSREYRLHYLTAALWHRIIELDDLAVKAAVSVQR